MCVGAALLDTPDPRRGAGRGRGRAGTRGRLLRLLYLYEFSCSSFSIVCGRNLPPFQTPHTPILHWGSEAFQVVHFFKFFFTLCVVFKLKKIKEINRYATPTRVQCEVLCA